MVVGVTQWHAPPRNPAKAKKTTVRTMPTKIAIKTLFM